MTKDDLTKKINTEFIQCSEFNIPNVDEPIFYPLYNPIIDEPHLKEGVFIESKKDGKYFVVRLFGVGRFFEKAENFYTKKI